MGFRFCPVSMTTVTTSVETQFIWLPGKSFRVGETADDKSYFIILIPIHNYYVDSIPDLYSFFAMGNFAQLFMLFFSVITLQLCIHA